MNDLIDFADIGPIPEPTIWTKPPLDLDAIEAKITGLTPQWPLPGPAEKAMRELIEEVRKLRAAPSTQPRQWEPWIPWKGGECPIPDAKAGEFGLKFRAESMIHPECVPARIFAGWGHQGLAFDIIAYRVLALYDERGM